MPLVILEGPDGSGKSTLAARLLKGTGQPTLLIKRSGPPGSIETLKFQAAWIEEQAGSRLNIIADRHPLISETLYAPHVRKVETPPWTEAEALSHFDQFRIDAKPLVIYCRAPIQRMVQASRVEDQMEGVHKEYLKLVTAYDDFMVKLARRDIEIRRHDFTEDPPCLGTLALVTHFFAEAL